MGCPKCQSDDISDSGICLACGYVTSIDAADDEYEPEPGTENGESASGSEDAESGNDPDWIEEDYSDGDPEKKPEEKKPSWRQELSQRLQAIKQKRETVAQSRQSKPGDGKPYISPEWARAGQPSVPFVPAKLEVPLPVRRPVPMPITPPPRQKSLQPLSAGLSERLPVPQEAQPRDAQVLIDNAVSGKAPQSPVPIIADGLSGPSLEPLPDDEGKLILLSRTLSGLVDLIIVMLCSGVCIIAADFFSGIIALDAFSYLIFSALVLLTYFFYSLYFLAASNQTIGMMITDLHVVDADGNRPSVSQLLRRCFGHIASVLVLGLGLLWSLFDRESQCFHDRISDTRVLRL